MQPRIKFDPARYRQAFQAMIGLNGAVRSAGLEPALLELVKIRASQINGCGYCIDMHTKDARAHGESEQRLYLLSAWREATVYSDRERAALAWTEAVTRLDNQEVPDDVYERARAEFTEEELVALTLAIVAINGWNRLSIAFKRPAGDYQPGDVERIAAAHGS
ncbi:MAG TPA: carboxymuconolactone decarboxylase family protein [Gammaproteobacteria bacterium]